MAAIEALRGALAEVESDLAGLDERRAALERAAEGLRQAISALEGGGSSRAASPRRKAETPKRPTVTPDDLVAAVRSLGGSATVEQLVEQLGLPDGRSLNGARRVAVDEQRISYADRTYTLPSTDPRWPGDDPVEDSDAA